MKLAIKGWVVTFFVSLFAAICASCASFPQGELGAIPDTWPPREATEMKTVQVSVTAKMANNGKAVDAPAKQIKKWRDFTTDIYKGSRMFEDVRNRLDSAQIYANVEYDIDIKAPIFPGALNGLFLIPGLILWPIPSSATASYTVTTEFLDNEGNKLGKVTQRETIKTWMHFVMYFMLPFKSPGSVEENTLGNIHKLTLLEAKKNGWL